MGVRPSVGRCPMGERNRWLAAPRLCFSVLQFVSRNGSSRCDRVAGEGANGQKRGMASIMQGTVPHNQE